MDEVIETVADALPTVVYGMFCWWMGYRSKPKCWHPPGYRDCSWCRK